MNRIKLIVFKLMLLFITTTLFVNCEKDSIVDIPDETITVAKEVPFSSRLAYTTEIENNSIISQKLRGLQVNSHQASLENDNNGFTVDTSIAKYVEKTDGSGYSYTFRITRNNIDEVKLENLVISFDIQTDVLTTNIVKYDFTDEQFSEFLSIGHVSTPYQTIIEPIDGDFSHIVSENITIDPCTYSVTTFHITPDSGDVFEYGAGSTCQHINEETGESDCEIYTVINIHCPPTSGSGSSSTGTSDTGGNPIDPTNSTTGGSNTNGNTDTSNDSNNDVVTSPILMPQQVIGDCMNANSFQPRLSQDMLTWLQENRHISSSLSNYLLNVGCDDSAKDFVDDAIEAMMADPNLTFEEYIRDRVEEHLEDKPFGLIETPCSEIEKWQALALHTAPPPVFNRVHAIDNQDTTYFTDYDIQTIENAEGHLVNMDYFPVKINSFPINPSTNLPYTPEEFLTYFRLNINSFVDNSWAVFTPVVYQNGSFSIDDTDLWNSNNPLTALLTLDIPADDGTVIVSDYSSSNFTVITLETPWDSEHPVSGVRDFGFTQTNSGSYVFYTRAVDRMEDGFDYAIANSPIPNDVAFFGSDALWSSFQDKLSTFVNFNGGNASIESRETYRPTWEKIKKVLRGEISIDELDCLE